MFTIFSTHLVQVCCEIAFGFQPPQIRSIYRIAQHPKAMQEVCFENALTQLSVCVFSSSFILFSALSSPSLRAHRPRAANKPAPWQNGRKRWRNPKELRTFGAFVACRSVHRHSRPGRRRTDDHISTRHQLSTNDSLDCSRAGIWFLSPTAGSVGRSRTRPTNLYDLHLSGGIFAFIITVLFDGPDIWTW